MRAMRLGRRFGVRIGTGMLGTLVLTASLAVPQWLTTGAPARAATAAAGGYTALTGARLLDTRRTGGALAVGVPRSVQVTGVGGVPAGGVAAVAVTVTATGAPVGGYLAVYPDDAAAPRTSTVNFPAGATVANQTVVAVSATGRIAVRSGVGTAHAVIDVTGWFAAGEGTVAGGFAGTTPTRLLDTRQTGGPLSGSGTVRNLQVGGVAGVPADAGAAVLNVTMLTARTSATYVTVWPAGKARPATSSVNAPAASIVANLTVVGLGTGGAVSISPGGAGVTDVLVDLLGYHRAGSPDAGGLQPVPPTRVADTRKAGGVVGTAGTIEVQTTGRAGVPVARVAAVVVTITAVPATKTGGYLTVWPSGAARPPTSALNPRPDTPVAGTGLYAVGADGGIDVFNSTGTVHVVVDVTGYVLAPAPAVVPASTGADLSPLTGAAELQARQILTNTNRYTLNTWWPTTGQAMAASVISSPDGVRRTSMVALSLAVAVSTGGYDEAATGVPAATATARAAELVDAVAAAHLSNRAGGWGDTWQSSMLSSLAGRAAWLIWADLPAATQDRVSRMVEWEADQSLLVPTRYLRDRTGRLLTSGDSGAEENSWYALAPALGVAMFPQHPHRTAWLHQQEQLQIAAWARPSAASSTSLVDGRALTSWLGGSNVEADGSVVNHGRFAPDYATTTYQSIDTVLMSSLAGTSAPQSSTWSLFPVYAAQVAKNYAVPTYLSPGGTVYSRSTATIYYPQGCDWGVGQELPYALADAQAQLFGFDSTGTAAGNLSRHVSAQLAKQARATDGGTYVDGVEYNYVGREEHTAQLAGQLYLSYFAAERLHPTVTSMPAAWNAGGRLVPTRTASTGAATRMAPFDERRLQTG